MRITGDWMGGAGEDGVQKSAAVPVGISAAGRRVVRTIGRRSCGLNDRVFLHEGSNSESTRGLP